MAQHLKSHVHFLQYIGFNSTDVPDSIYLIFQTQAIENYDVYVSSQGCLYLQIVGKGMVSLYLRRRDDSGGFYGYNAGS